MIVRIQSEGQYRLDDTALAEINRLDAAMEASLEQGPEALEAALAAMEDRVRELGSKVADDELSPSDVILPPADSTADEVRALLADDGLIPG